MSHKTNQDQFHSQKDQDWYLSMAGGFPRGTLPWSSSYLCRLRLVISPYGMSFMIAKVAILQRDNGVEPRKNDLNHANHLLDPIKTAMVVLQQLILVWPTAATVDNSPGKSWKMLRSHITLPTSAKWHMSSFLMLLRDGSGLRVSCNIGEISSRTNVGVNVKEAAFRNPTPVSGTLWFDEYDLSAKEAKYLTPRFRRTPSTSQCPDRDILRRIVPSARISLSSSGSTRPERVPTVRPIIRKLRIRFVGVDWNANTAVTIVPVNLSQRSRHNITVTKMKLNLSKDMRVDSRRLLLSRSISLSSSTSLSKRSRKISAAVCNRCWSFDMACRCVMLAGWRMNTLTGLCRELLLTFPKTRPQSDY